MPRSLVQCQFAAFGAGVLLIGAFALATALVLLVAILVTMLSDPLGFLVGILLEIGVIFVLPCYAAYWVARYARPHLGVAFITTLLPALILLVLEWMAFADFKIFVEAKEPGPLRDMLHPAMGYWSFCAIGLALFAGYLGIRKEWRSNDEPLPDQESLAVRLRQSLPFAAFLLLLLGAVASLAFAHFEETRQANTVEARVAKARKVLEESGVDDQWARAILDLQPLKTNEEAAEVLRKAMKNLRNPIAKLAASALAAHGDISALPYLEPDLMKSGEWNGELDEGQFPIPVQMAPNLAYFTNPEAAPALARLMGSKDREVRLGAAQSLRHIHSDVALEALLAGLNDPYREVRWTSVTGLAEIVGKAGGVLDSDAPTWEEFLKAEPRYLSHWKKWGEARPASQRSDSVTPQNLSNRQFTDPWEKNSPAGLVATAREVLDSPTSTMGQRAKVLFDIQNLIDEEDAQAVLGKAMKDQPAPLNLLAAAGLAERGDLSALPLLEASLMKSGEWNYSWDGFRATADLGYDLGRFTDLAAVPALVRLMKSEDPKVRHGAAQSLRHMQDDRAIEAMINGLEDSDWGVRWISVMGLAEVMGKPSGEKESWCPARDNFRQNEAKYLEHWKQRGAAWQASR